MSKTICLPRNILTLALFTFWISLQLCLFKFLNQEGRGWTVNNGSGDNPVEWEGRTPYICEYMCVSLPSFAAASCHLLSSSGFLYLNPISLPVLARSQMFHRLRIIGKQWYIETLLWRKTKTHPEEEDYCLAPTRWQHKSVVPLNWTSLSVIQKSALSLPGVSIVFFDSMHIGAPVL